jgi:hypothetical protein
MKKRRRRFRQSNTLEQLLSGKARNKAGNLREEARQLPPSVERNYLRREAR